MKRLLTSVTALAFSVLFACIPALAAQQFPEPHPHPLKPLRVVCFKSALDLPIWIAQRQGFFADNGLGVRLDYTPGSTWLMTHLLSGDYDIGMTAIDNLIAYDEGQGEAYVPKDVPIDLIGVLGFEGSFLTVGAKAPVSSIADLKGKTITIDSPKSGFAFLLREVLAKGGVQDSDVTFVKAGGVADRFQDLMKNPEHHATILLTPFDLLLESKGGKTLANARDVVGPYEGNVAAMRRSWAMQNRDEVVGFRRALQCSLDWLRDPQNRPVAEALLVANLPNMTTSMATKTYNVLTDDKTGFRKHPELDMEGIKTVLRLRTKYAEPHKDLSDPSKYIDLQYSREMSTP